MLSEWSGIDQEALKKMLSQGGVDSDFTLTSKINGLIKEEQKKIEEKKKKDEEIEQKKKIEKVQQVDANPSNTVINVSMQPGQFILEEVKVEEIEIKFE